MPLTEDDFKAMRVLFEQTLEPFRDQVNRRFNDVTSILEGIVANDEKREQEYLIITEQLSRIEKRVEGIDSRVDGIETRVEDIEKRVETLELP